MSTCSVQLLSTLESFSSESTRGRITLDGQRRSGRLTLALPSTHSAVAILVTVTCGVVVGSFVATASSTSALPSAMQPLYVPTLTCSDALAANAYNRQCRDIPVPFVSAAAGCAVRGCAYLAIVCATTAADELPSVACSARCLYDDAPTPLGFAPAGTPPRASPSQAQTGFFTFISLTCACSWVCRHPWKPWPPPPMSPALIPLANTSRPCGSCTSSPSGPHPYIIQGSSFVPEPGSRAPCAVCCTLEPQQPATTAQLAICRPRVPLPTPSVFTLSTSSTNSLVRASVQFTAGGSVAHQVLIHTVNTHWSSHEPSPHLHVPIITSQHTIEVTELDNSGSGHPSSPRTPGTSMLRCGIGCSTQVWLAANDDSNPPPLHGPSKSPPDLREVSTPIPPQYASFTAYSPSPYLSSVSAETACMISAANLLTALSSVWMWGGWMDVVGHIAIFSFSFNHMARTLHSQSTAMLILLLLLISIGPASAAPPSDSTSSPLGESSSTHLSDTLLALVSYSGAAAVALATRSLVTPPATEQPTERRRRHRLFLAARCTFLYHHRQYIRSLTPSLSDEFCVAATTPAVAYTSSSDDSTAEHPCARVALTNSLHVWRQRYRSASSLSDRVSDALCCKARHLTYLTFTWWHAYTYGLSSSDESDESVCSEYSSPPTEHPRPPTASRDLAATVIARAWQGHTVSLSPVPFPSLEIGTTHDTSSVVSSVYLSAADSDYDQALCPLQPRLVAPSMVPRHAFCHWRHRAQCLAAAPERLQGIISHLAAVAVTRAMLHFALTRGTIDDEVIEDMADNCGVDVSLLTSPWGACFWLRLLHGGLRPSMWSYLQEGVLVSPSPSQSSVPHPSQEQGHSSPHTSLPPSSPPPSPPPTDLPPEPLPEQYAPSAELSTAVTAALAAQSGTVTLQPRQTMRSAIHSAWRAAERAASGCWQSQLHILRLRQSGRKRTAAHLFRDTPASVLYQLAFIYTLRRRALASSSAIVRRTTDASRSRVLELRSSRPKPLPSFDVGVCLDGSLEYQSEHGVISNIHPAASPTTSPDALVPLGLSLSPDGSFTTPLIPPPQSTFTMCPDASGAICYIDRALGSAQWDAPEGSSPLSPQPLVRPPDIWTEPPPRYPAGLAIASLRGTSWYPMYLDRTHEVRFYHAETGSVRSAPWICLRTIHGAIYFANLITHQTRWLPPHRWMADWISHAYLDDTGLHDAPFQNVKLGQLMHPVEISCMRIEGGSPYLQPDPHGHSCVCHDD